MHVTSRENARNVLHTPQGEIIYELVGRGDDSGAVEQHSLAYVIIPPEKSSVRHYHQDAEETYYILKGEGWMEIDDEEFALTPGQACLIEAGEVHRIENRGEENLEFLAACAPAWTAEDSYQLD